MLFGNTDESFLRDGAQSKTILFTFYRASSCVVIFVDSYCKRRIIRSSVDAVKNREHLIAGIYRCPITICTGQTEEKDHNQKEFHGQLHKID